MKIVVFTRFSEIRSNAAGVYKAGAGTHEDYIARILDPARLKLRMTLFKNILLPSFVSQLPKLDVSTFRWVITTSQELPRGIRNELEQAIAPYPWAEIRVNANIIEITKNFLDEDKGGPAQNFASVRIDDDDAVSKEFFNKLSRYDSENFVNHVVSFPSGYSGWFDPESETIAGVVNTYHPMNSIGLAYIGRYDGEKIVSLKASIYEVGSHNKADRMHPVIIDSRQNMYFRTIHKSQDTSDVSLKEIIGKAWAQRDDVLKEIALPQNVVAKQFREPDMPVSGESAVGWVAAINTTLKHQDPRKATELSRAGINLLPETGMKVANVDDNPIRVSGILVHSEQDLNRCLVAVKKVDKSCRLSGFAWSEHGDGFWFRYLKTTKADPNILFEVPAAAEG